MHGDSIPLLPPDGFEGSAWNDHAGGSLLSQSCRCLRTVLSLEDSIAASRVENVECGRLMDS